MFCRLGAEMDGMGYVLRAGIPIGPPGTLFLAAPILDEVSPMRYPLLTLLLLLFMLPPPTPTPIPIPTLGPKFGTLAVMPQ